jgi:3-dehydroquinate dehydratase / shikimate dehydrogenase
MCPGAAGRSRAAARGLVSEVAILQPAGTAAARQASLVATLTTPLTPELAAGLAGVEWLEIRADLAGEPDPEALRRHFPGKLLYTLRSRAEGGGFEGSPERRKRRLLDAAARYDRIDLEAARDLAPEILTAVPPARRLISWHGAASDVEALAACFARMAAAEAALYKLVPAMVQPGDALAPLLLLFKLERTDVVAFAGGAAGVWTRLLAPRLGAPVVFGAAGELPGAPGQPSIASLREDFGLPDLPPVDSLFGLVGNPVAHSLSPRLHNGAYRELGIPALYLPFQTESFGDFWLEVVEEGALDALGLPLRGLSITAPFKAAALAVAGAESPLAGVIGGANTLVLRDGVWEAESTDPEGVVAPLLARGVTVAGCRAAVVGAGGGGRAAAVGLSRAGAEVTLFNRNPERGAAAAADLGLPCLPLGDLDPARFDVLVNATPLGRAGPEEGEPLPFAVEAVRPGAAVIDLVYRRGSLEGQEGRERREGGADDGPTALLAAAARRGAITIDGREVLLGQAQAQFQMMTGQELPAALARRLLGLPPAAGQLTP